MLEPVGFVTGIVTDGGAPPALARVRVEYSPFVSVVETNHASYVLAPFLGEASIRGRSLSTGHAASVQMPVPTAGEIHTAGLDLVESRPTVASVTPANGAEGVALGTNVAIIFSAEVDRATVTTTTFSLEQGGAPRRRRRRAAADRRTAVFIPAAPLAENATFTVVVTTTVTDEYGQALLGNQPRRELRQHLQHQGHHPARGAGPGEVTVTIPENGTTTITGAQAQRSRAAPWQP